MSASERFAGGRASSPRRGPLDPGLKRRDELVLPEAPLVKRQVAVGAHEQDAAVLRAELVLELALEIHQRRGLIPEAQRLRHLLVEYHAGRTTPPETSFTDRSSPAMWRRSRCSRPAPAARCSPDGARRGQPRPDGQKPASSQPGSRQARTSSTRSGLPLLPKPGRSGA